MSRIELKSVSPADKRAYLKLFFDRQKTTVGPVERALLTFLIEREIDKQFGEQKTDPAEMFEEFYRAYYETLEKKGKSQALPTDCWGAGKKVIGTIKNHLERYYSERGAGHEDAVQIEITGGIGTDYRPFYTEEEKEELPIQLGPDSVASELCAKLTGVTIHAYYLTLDKHANQVWCYTVMKFELADGDADPTACSSIIPSSDVPADQRQKHTFVYTAWVEKKSLIVRTLSTDGSDDVTYEMFPNISRFEFPFVGLRMTTATWLEKAVPTISIWSDHRLPCAPDAVDGELISDPKVMGALRAYWDANTDRPRIKLLALV